LPSFQALLPHGMHSLQVFQASACMSPFLLLLSSACLCQFVSVNLFLLCHFLAMSRVYHIPFLFSILYPHFTLSFSRINVLIFISYSIICFIHISLKNPPYFSFVSNFSYPCFMTLDLLKTFSGCTVQSRYLYPISLKSASACCIISYCK